MTSKNQKPQVVISMTSFPPAIPYAIQAVRSLLNGSVLPDKLILYVTLAQFPEGKLPDDLLALSQENAIFEIRNYDRDIRSYRKLIPAYFEFPEALIITVDDDVHYHRHLLRDLLSMHRRHPHAILAHRARHIHMDKPYRKWKKYRWYHFLFKRIHRSYLNLQTGVGGVLYPPHSLKAEMLDPDLFTRIAPSTDDIWFWAAGVANGYPVIPVPFGYNKPRDLHKPSSMALKTINFKRGTDLNVAAIESICNYFPDIKLRLESETK